MITTNDQTNLISVFFFFERFMTGHGMGISALRRGIKQRQLYSTVITGRHFPRGSATAYPEEDRDGNVMTLFHRIIARKHEDFFGFYSRDNTWPDYVPNGGVPETGKRAGFSHFYIN